MKIKIFQLDVFTNKLFSGNPAAVCPLEFWLDDKILQSIASENNLSETAFFVKGRKGFEIRWFTPVTEIDLCGHATMASAFVIFSMGYVPDDEIVFNSRTCNLFIKRKGDYIIMEFPLWIPKVTSITKDLIKGLGKKPSEVLCSEDYLVMFDSEEEVKNLTPDFEILKNIPLRAVIATSVSDDFDYVLRCFCPKIGVNEDPATGSAQCTLAPYWAKRLKKETLNSSQLSTRGGTFSCKVSEDKVFISGSVIRYMEGKIYL